MIFPQAFVNLRKLFVFLQKGETTLPRRGIGEIPKQMAAQLPAEQLKLGHYVSEVHPQEIKTKDGKSWQGKAVVLATDFEITNQFLGVEGQRG